MNTIFRYSTATILQLMMLAELGTAQSPASAGMPGASARMGFGARGMGMGNAMSAVVTGDLATYYNPAVAPYQSTPTGAASFGLLSFDRRLNFLSLTRHVKPEAGISLYALNAGVGNIDGRDRDGVSTETYATSENQFGLSFALNPNPAISFGLTAKILYYHLYANINSTTVGIDLGMVYRFTDQWTAGLVFQDVGSKYKWDTGTLYGKSGNNFEEKFPVRSRLGLSYRSDFIPLLAAAEYESIAGESYVRCGLEVTPLDAVEFRAGIDQVSLNQSVTAKPSFGLSFRADAGQAWIPWFHYAYVLEPYGSSGIHMLSLSVRFP